MKSALWSVALGVLLHGSPALAGLQMWDFQSWSQSFEGSGLGNQLNLTASNGTGLTVTAWSNTDYSSTPAGVESAELVWSNSSALGVYNVDETGGLPDTSVDSITSDSMGGYDMLLLEFDSEVGLSGLDLNWAVGGSDLESTDLSILAWGGLGSDMVEIGNWADILLGNGGGYDVVGNYSDVDLSYFSVDSTVTSSTWLIGAYNPIFGAGGDAGDDGFALASLSTYGVEEFNESASNESASEVPAPGTLALAVAGILLLGHARRRAR